MKFPISSCASNSRVPSSSQRARDRVEQLVRHPLRAEGVEDARRDARGRGAEVRDEPEVRGIEPRVELAERQHPRRPDGLGRVDLHAELHVELLRAGSSRSIDAPAWPRSGGGARGTRAGRRSRAARRRYSTISSSSSRRSARTATSTFPSRHASSHPCSSTRREEPPLDVGRARAGSRGSSGSRSPRAQARGPAPPPRTTRSSKRVTAGMEVGREAVERRPRGGAGWPPSRASVRRLRLHAALAHHEGMAGLDDVRDPQRDRHVELVLAGLEAAGPSATTRRRGRRRTTSRRRAAAGRRARRRRRSSESRSSSLGTCSPSILTSRPSSDESGSARYHGMRRSKRESAVAGPRASRRSMTCSVSMRRPPLRSLEEEPAAEVVLPAAHVVAAHRVGVGVAFPLARDGAGVAGLRRSTSMIVAWSIDGSFAARRRSRRTCRARARPAA